MKKITHYLLPFLAFAALPLMAESSAAEKAKSGNAELKDGEFSNLSVGMRIHLIKKFDKDGDGKLNDEERAEAKKALEEKKQKFDEMLKQHAKKIMSKFDKNKDGVLDESELAEFLKEHHKMMAKHREQAMRQGNKGMQRGFEKNGRPGMRRNGPPACCECAKKFDCPKKDKCEARSECPLMNRCGDKPRMQGNRNFGMQGKPGMRRHGPPPPELIAKFDKDGDGKLNDEERKAMREEIKQKHEALLKKYDKDGDGKLNKEERAELLKDPEVVAHMQKVKEARQKRMEEMKARGDCPKSTPCCEGNKQLKKSRKNKN